jgi:hypothetical protein
LEIFSNLRSNTEYGMMFGLAIPTSLKALMTGGGGVAGKVARERLPATIALILFSIDES